MGYPPTDHIGFTIKTKGRKIFKHRSKGMIFDSREQAQAWINQYTEEYDQLARGKYDGATLSADERIALENCEIINVQGNL